MNPGSKKVKLNLTDEQIAALKDELGVELSELDLELVSGGGTKVVQATAVLEPVTLGGPMFN